MSGDVAEAAAGAVAVIEAQAEADVAVIEAHAEAETELIEARAEAAAEAEAGAVSGVLETEGRITWLEERIEAIEEALTNLVALAAVPSTQSPSSETRETSPLPETAAVEPETIRPAREDGPKASPGGSRKRRLRFL